MSTSGRLATVTHLNNERVQIVSCRKLERLTKAEKKLKKSKRLERHGLSLNSRKQRWSKEIICSITEGGNGETSMEFCPREDFWPRRTDWNRTGVSEEARKTHYSQQTSPVGGVMHGLDLVSPSSFQNLHWRQLSSENRAGPRGHAHSLNLNQEDRDQGQGTL